MNKILYFIFCLMAASAAAQQTGSLMPLTTTDGYGTFTPSERIIFPLRSMPGNMVIPKNIQDFRVLIIDFQPFNHDYRMLNKMQNSQGADKEFRQGIKGDSLYLTLQPYNHRMHILYSKIDSQSFAFTPDLNFNLNFEDDTTVSFHRDALTGKPGELSRLIRTVRFEYFNGKEIVPLAQTISLRPSMGTNLSIKTADAKDADFILIYSIFHHRSLVFKRDSSVAILEISNGFTSPFYSTANTKLFLYDSGSKPSAPTREFELYNIHDLIPVQKGSVRIDSIDRMGNLVNVNFIDSPRNDGLAIGVKAPLFEADLLSGGSIKLSAYRGKKVLLDFWGTWCTPCIKQIPVLASLHNQSESLGLTIVSILNDYNRHKVKKFVNEHNLTWPQIFQDEIAHGKENKIVKMYDVGTYPTFILIDENGITRFRENDLSKIVASLHAERK